MDIMTAPSDLAWALEQVESVCDAEQRFIALGNLRSGQAETVAILRRVLTARIGAKMEEQSK